MSDNFINTKTTQQDAQKLKFGPTRTTLTNNIITITASIAIVITTLALHQNYTLTSTIIALTLLLLTATLYNNKLATSLSTTIFYKTLLNQIVNSSPSATLLVKYDGTIIYKDSSIDNKESNIIPLLEQTLSLNSSSKEILLAALKNVTVETIKLSNDQTLAISPIKLPKSTANKGLKLAANKSQFSNYFIIKIENTATKESYQPANLISDFSFATYSINHKGMILEVNSALEKLLGYQKNEPIARRTHLSSLLKKESDIDTLLKNNSQYTGEITLKNKKGDDVPVLISQINTNDTKLAIIIPVSEKAKPTTSDTFSSTINTSPIPTALIDNDGNIEKSNKKCDLLLNKKTKDKSNIINFIVDLDQDILKKAIEHIITDHKPLTKPIDIRIKDDKETSASLYLSPIFNKNKDCTGIIIHLIDNTDFKNLELQFVHSQKMHAVGQLAGGIAHDFNNLLTAMMGFCDLLLMRHPAGDASFADIMQVKQNASRAANLVRQLLAFSRKQTLQPQIINVTDNLADLSNLVGRLIGEHTTLHVDHGLDLDYIRVDRVQLEQIIINLAVNARDAMPNGGNLNIKTSNITIDKKTRPPKGSMSPEKDEPIRNGKYVLLEVKDEGCGIPKESIKDIFEPFFSTKAIGAGTGLGLSTVYGIVKQADGYIYISSKKNKGTTFHLYLKSYTHEEIAEQLRAQEEQNKPLPKMDLTGQGTILVVEDESPVRIFSTTALASKGYHILEAASGTDALAIVKEKGSTIDMIITDVIMPDINGPELVEKIKKDHPKLKVIFTSGYGEDAFKKTYGEKRSFNFLPKPYTLKQLTTRVKELMNTN